MISHYLIQTRDGTESISPFYVLKKALRAAEREAKRTGRPWDVIMTNSKGDWRLRFYTNDGKTWKIEQLQTVP